MSRKFPKTLTRPNLALNSDPACIAFRSLSIFRFLGSAPRLGAGGAGYLLSLGAMTNPYWNLKRVALFAGSAALMILLPITCVSLINSRAKMKAQSFCNSVELGESIQNVIARANSQQAIVITETKDSKVLILFHGFVYEYATCKLEVQNNKVKTKSVAEPY